MSVGQTGRHLTLSDALSLFSDHLVDVRKACVQNLQVVQSKPGTELDVDKPITRAAIREHLVYLDVQKRSSNLERVIRRIDGRKQYMRKGGVTDEMIQRAREYPIKELFIELTGDTPHRGMAQCPFHDDSSPSLSLRFKNRYHCFGCDEKGDTISLYMKINNVSFLDAVKALQ